MAPSRRVWPILCHWSAWLSDRSKIALVNVTKSERTDIRKNLSISLMLCNDQVCSYYDQSGARANLQGKY